MVKLFYIDNNVINVVNNYRVYLTLFIMQNIENCGKILLVSTCERLCVMQRQAGVVGNLVQKSQFTLFLGFGPQFTPLPSPPPSPENWNLGKSWHFKTFQFWLAQNTPPPPKIKI